MNTWKHQSNHDITRFTDGTMCHTCGEFFAMGSDEYLRCDGLDSLWMVLHNLYVGNHRLSGALRLIEKIRKIDHLKDDITILRLTEKEALAYIYAHGKTEKSASIPLSF